MFTEDHVRIPVYHGEFEAAKASGKCLCVAGGYFWYSPACPVHQGQATEESVPHSEESEEAERIWRAMENLGFFEKEIVDDYIGQWHGVYHEDKDAISENKRRLQKILSSEEKKEKIIKMEKELITPLVEGMNSVFERWSMSRDKAESLKQTLSRGLTGFLARCLEINFSGLCLSSVPNEWHHFCGNYGCTHNHVIDLEEWNRAKNGALSDIYRVDRTIDKIFESFGRLTKFIFWLNPELKIFLRKKGGEEK